MAANVGNFLPTRGAYTYSLSSPDLATMIGKRIDELQADLCLIQEAWTYPSVLLGDAYDWLGLNDAIAVKRSFGCIVPGSFTSHSIRFTQAAGEPVVPPRKGNDVAAAVARQVERLRQHPYDGTPANPYGIPVDFDVTGAIIETHDKERFLVTNVHVRSASWHDAERAMQLRDWILLGAIPRAVSETGGRVIIGGDFNCDEGRQGKQASASVIREILAVDGMQDAAAGNKEITTNFPWPIPNYRYDHILGTCIFENYVVGQSLTARDLAAFKHRHAATWWMHLDHRHVRARFTFP